MLVDAVGMYKAGLVYARSAGPGGNAAQAIAERPVTIADITECRGIVVKPHVAGTDLTASPCYPRRASSTTIVVTRGSSQAWCC